eukprot:CAMPEP_0170183132 /NCGR_PEP_ID=MMETSP0040_2-20121228/29726_1 /TAXON_ID=641309 /ORGANISM="Lotharella oceanica, Strain CCMP622" /LENGTH=398 /DNA_ID=CAMNT_0010428771 /DNA_START=247 /DNA_END=1443 /DNA_ORIENTATION=-
MEAYANPDTIVTQEFVTRYQDFGILLCMRRLGFAGECPNPDLPFPSPDGNVYVGAARQMVRLNTTRTEINVYDNVPTVDVQEVFPGTLGKILKTCWQLEPFSSTKGARYELTHDYDTALATPEVLQFNIGWINGTSRFKRNSPCTRMYLVAYSSNGVKNLESKMNEEANTAVPVDTWNTLVQSQPALTKKVKLDGTKTYRVKLNTMAVSSEQVSDEILANGEVRVKYKKDLKFSLMVFSPNGMDWLVETSTERLSYTWMDFMSSFFSFVAIVFGVLGWCFPKDPYTGRVFFQFGSRNNKLKNHFSKTVPMLNKDWDESEVVVKLEEPQGNKKFSVRQGSRSSRRSLRRGRERKAALLHKASSKTGGTQNGVPVASSSALLTQTKEDVDNTPTSVRVFL